MEHGSVRKGGGIPEDMEMVHREGLKAPYVVLLQQGWLKSMLLI